LALLVVSGLSCWALLSLLLGVLVAGEGFEDETGGALLLVLLADEGLEHCSRPHRVQPQQDRQAGRQAAHSESGPLGCWKQLHMHKS
jgi:hypothetical protein